VPEPLGYVMRAYAISQQAHLAGGPARQTDPLCVLCTAALVFDCLRRSSWRLAFASPPAPGSFARSPALPPRLWPELHFQGSRPMGTHRRRACAPHAATKPTVNSL
jgi:hypothetical protein